MRKKPNWYEHSSRGKNNPYKTLFWGVVLIILLSIPFRIWAMKVEADRKVEASYNLMLQINKTLQVKDKEIEQLREQKEEVENENKELQKQVSLPIRDKVIAEINSVFGKKAPQALAVARCESGFDPDRVNINSNLSRDYSVFQINDRVWTKVFGEGFKTDWKENIQVAKAIFDRNGDWRAWYSSEHCWKDRLAQK